MVAPIASFMADHAIEHENRTMKVLAGIKVLANDININKHKQT